MWFVECIEINFKYLNFIKIILTDAAFSAFKVSISMNDFRKQVPLKIHFKDCLNKKIFYTNFK